MRRGHESRIIFVILPNEKSKTTYKYFIDSELVTKYAYAPYKNKFLHVIAFRVEWRDFENRKFHMYVV